MYISCIACKLYRYFTKFTGVVLHVHCIGNDCMYMYCAAFASIVLYVKVMYCMDRDCTACTLQVLFCMYIYCTLYRYCSACTFIVHCRGIVLHVHCKGILLPNVCRTMDGSEWLFFI